MAHQKGQLLKTVVYQAGADIIQHMVIGVGFQCDGAAEVPVFCAQTYGDDRKYQHGKI